APPRALEPRRALRRARRHSFLAGRRAPRPGGLGVVKTGPPAGRAAGRRGGRAPPAAGRVRKRSCASLASDPRPLVVLAGPIHADGKALLDKEARVVVCEDETEAGLVKVAAEAQGILFRIRPRCTESLMAACKRLKVVGRHGVGLDTVDI